MITDNKEVIIMSEVTAPIMTDATGQSIDSKLNSLLGKMDDLAAAFQPNASGIVYSNTTSGLTGDDVQEAIDEMAADVSEIKSSLSNLGGDGYTAPPSGSYATNVSYGAGGYCRIGKIIILNLRIGLSQNISANTTLVSNLPIPNANANIVSVMNNRKADITLGTSGQITTADGLNAGNVILSCVYLTSN